MTIGVLQSTLFGDMFGTEAMCAAFGEDAFIARCIEVEAALARAQARLGIVPADAAAAISAAATELAAHPERLDRARLKRETANVGYPILPLVRQLSEKAGEAGRYLHWGATTQDIMDSAVVLQIRAGLDLIEADLGAARGHVAALARKYRDTPMAGRTHLQHALPVTFGYKAAVWLSALDRHAARLAQFRPLGGLIVDVARMERNLGMTHGLIVAEAVMMGLAPALGRNEAHDLVYDACREAIEQDKPLADVLLATPQVADALGADKVRALIDPANYLGAAPAMVDRVLNGR